MTAGASAAGPGTHQARSETGGFRWVDRLGNVTSWKSAILYGLRSIRSTSGATLSVGPKSADV